MPLSAWCWAMARGSCCLPTRRCGWSWTRTQSIPQLQLEQGQVESYVIKRISEHDRFQIRTSVGVLGVRGTHFPHP